MRVQVKQNVQGLGKIFSYVELFFMFLTKETKDPTRENMFREAELKSDPKPRNKDSIFKLGTHLGSLFAETEAMESKFAALRLKLARERGDSRYGGALEEPIK